MVVIGITGTNGAGKGTIVNYLAKKGKFRHLSVRDFIAEEIRNRNLPVNRNNLIIVGNELRKKYGPAYIAEVLFEQAKKSNKDSIIESLRNPAEVSSLKKKGTFHLFAVDANPQLRYSRIRARASETDNISFNEFLAQEKREISSDDPTKQNIQKVMSMADFKFVNNGSFKKLYAEIEKTLAKILPKK